MLKKIPVFFLIFLFAFFCEAETPEELAALSDEAVAAENWEKAVGTLQSGIKQYPDNDFLLLKLGIIYYSKELYKPAYKIFKKGLSLNKNNTELLFYASAAAAALNKNEEALQYIKLYLSYIPDDRFAASNYGWLCFKCHKAREGIDYCLKNIDLYGAHTSVYNSLGTLYSEIFDYKNAKKFYTKAIQLAKSENKNYSASIYYYNKAILENQFYNFAAALEDAEEALNMQERNSSYMMIGELYERKNDFAHALSSYAAAASIDDTPLSGFNIGNIFLSTGNFEKAERYSESLFNSTNDSWISNYGMSVNEFKSEIYKFKQMLYEQKYNFEKAKLTLNLADWFKTFFRKIDYKLKYKYYDSVYRIYSLKVAKEYKKNNTQFLNDTSHVLHINSLYYKAFNKKNDKSLKYLKKAEQIETEFVPQSKGSYTAEKAIIKKDLKMLNDGISKMDPEWEKNTMETLYAEGIKIAKSRSSQFYYLYLQSLFDINPAAFLQYDIYMPVKIIVNLPKDKTVKISVKKIAAIIGTSRFIEDPNSKFELHINYSGAVLSFRFLHKNGRIFFRRNFDIEKLDKINLKKSANVFVKEVFSIKL